MNTDVILQAIGGEKVEKIEIDPDEHDVEELEDLLEDKPIVKAAEKSAEKTGESEIEEEISVSSAK
jgi:hypothetical protein